jgi:hypothetical protein
MNNLYHEALSRRVLKEFAERRDEIERVELFTHDGRNYVLTGTGRPRDITPMGGFGS